MERTRNIQVSIDGQTLEFMTTEGLFSPKSADMGTLAMLSLVSFDSADRVLDLGCGYGIVGIYAACLIGADRVVMSDVSDIAVEAARHNAELNGVPEVRVIQSDGCENIPEQDFTCILSNPPYHTDFSVAKKFIEGGYARLVQGGRMIMVTKRLDWYKNKLTSVFGGVRVHEKDGYYIFISEKRGRKVKSEPKNKNNLSKKLMRKYKKREN